MGQTVFRSISLFKKLFILTLLVAVLPLGLSWMYFLYVEKNGLGGVGGNETSTVFYALLVFAFVLAGFGAFYFSKHIVRPIRHFIRSATDIARGDFTHKVAVESDDEIGRLAKIFNYMTEELRRLYERNLYKIINEKNKTEAILENIADGVILTNPSNQIELINYMAEYWFDLVGQNIIEQPIETSIENRRLMKFIRHFTDNGENKYQAIEVTIRPRKERKDIILQARAARVLDEKKNFIGVVTVLRDITREKEIDRLKTELVSMVAHELRSPLTSISGFSELLLDTGISREQGEEYASIILKESNRLGDLINKFLDISKIEAGKSQVRRSPVDLKFLIQRVLELNAQLAKMKNIKVTLESPYMVPTVNVDRDMMEQVILNLYSNAIKYSPDHASITVRVFEMEENLKVEFEDTGYGISENALPRIFDKFYRVSDNERINDTVGSGLGLSLVKEIIEIHGGNIEVSSKIGEGSVFTFTLPKTNGLPLDQTDELILGLSRNSV